MPDNSFIYDDKTLRANLKRFPGRVDRGIAGIVKQRASIAEGYARINAPWTDRTGNARSGLRTTTEHVPLVRHAWILFHSVTYGIWLEIRWAGRYAIILPTIQDQGKKMMLTVNKLFVRLDRG